MMQRRLEFERGEIMLTRFDETLRKLQAIAQIPMQARGVATQTHGAMVKRFGRDQLAAQRGDQAAMLPDIRALGREVQCLIEIFTRTVGPIDAEGGKAETVERVHIVRLFREDSLVIGNRFVMTPSGEAGVGMRGDRADIVGQVGVEWQIGFVHQRRSVG